MTETPLQKPCEVNDTNAFFVEKGIFDGGEFALGPNETKATAASIVEAEEGLVEKAKRKFRRPQSRIKAGKEPKPPSTSYWHLYRYWLGKAQGAKCEYAHNALRRRCP